MYKYIGSKDILKQVKPEQIGYPITSAKDILYWINNSAQEFNNQEITATFTIGQNYIFRLNDRRSEHVACAGGVDVLAAGEITFEVEQKQISISQITNQSTGYCPSPSSWKDINKVLSKLNIDYPEYFTQEFIFRVCAACGVINVIKDSFFVCIICNQDLPEDILFE